MFGCGKIGFFHKPFYLRSTTFYLSSLLYVTKSGFRSGGRNAEGHQIISFCQSFGFLKGLDKGLGVRYNMVSGKNTHDRIGIFVDQQFRHKPDCQCGISATGFCYEMIGKKAVAIQLVQGFDRLLMIGSQI